MNSYSVWECPHYHRKQLEPLPEDFIVFCHQITGLGDQAHLCGLKMHRRVLVEFGAAA